MTEPTHLQRAKDDFLRTYDAEHAKTVAVLRAYPEDQLDLRPHPKLKSAKELGWIFVMERGLGTAVFKDAFAHGVPDGTPPPPPEAWSELIGSYEVAHRNFSALIAETPAEELEKRVHFLVAPRRLGEISRMDWLWFLLHDEIHHRGQFSVYLRMAGGKVPSIYGPTADEPWI